MSISLELIEQVRERANVSYEEAKQALEKCNEDVVEALIYLEQQHKLKAPPSEARCQTGFWASVKKLIKASNDTKFVVSKNGNIVINLPLTIVILVTIIVPPLTVVGLLAALFTNHKLRMEKPGGENMKINKTLDDIATAASKVSEQVAEVIKQ